MHKLHLTKSTPLSRSRLPKKPPDPTHIEQDVSPRSGAGAGTIRRLEVIESELPVEPALRLTNAEEGIQHMLSHMFEEIPEKGLSRQKRIDIFQFRQRLPQIVMLHQLHSLFPDQQTDIDRELMELFVSGRIKRLAIRASDDGDYALIMGGEWKDMLEKSIQNRHTLQKFHDILSAHPTATRLSSQDVSRLSGKEITDLTNAGFLTFLPMQAYAISLPNFGQYVGLLLRARKIALRIIWKTPYHEMLENMLEERWSPKKWREFAGVNCNWILHDLVGSGRCELFQTPVGRGIVAKRSK